MSLRSKLFLATFFVIAGAGVAEAAFIYPTTASNIGGGAAFFPASQLLIPGDITPAETGTHPMDSSGGNTSLNSWVTDGNGADYFAAGTAPILRFTLSAATALDQIYLWPYGGNRPNSAKTFNLTYRDASLNSIGLVTGLTINSAPASGAAPRQSIAISAPSLTTFVDMTITDNYFGEAGFGAGGDRVGLGQVGFNAVPEPSSLAMMLFGAIGLWLVGRKRT